MPNGRICRVHQKIEIQLVIGVLQMQKIQEDMEKEIQDLKTERRQLEFHIERTEYWAEQLGNWKAHVSNAEVCEMKF